MEGTESVAAMMIWSAIKSRTWLLRMRARERWRRLMQFGEYRPVKKNGRGRTQWLAMHIVWFTFHSTTATQERV